MSNFRGEGMKIQKKVLSIILFSILFAALSYGVYFVIRNSEMLYPIYNEVIEYAYDHWLNMALLVIIGSLVALASYIITPRIANKKFYEKTNQKAIMVVSLIGVVCFAVISFTMSNSEFSRSDETRETVVAQGHSTGGLTIVDEPEKGMFFYEFIDAKDLYIHPEVAENIVDSILSLATTSDHVQSGESEKYGIFVDEELKYIDEDAAFNLPYSHEFISAGINYTFIVDDSYYNSESIILTTSDRYTNSYYLMSEEYYNSFELSDTTSPNRYEKEHAAVVFENPLYSEENTGYMTQLYILIAIFVVGILLLSVIKNSPLGNIDMVIAFPIGIAMYVVMFMLFYLTGIRLTQTTTIITFSVFSALAVLYTAYKVKYKAYKVEYKKIIPALVIFATVVVAFINVNKIYYGYDSLVTYRTGLIVSVNDGYLLNHQIPTFNAYGFLSTTLSSLGAVFNIGNLYALYPVIYMNIIAAVGIAAYTYAKKNGVRYAMLIACIASAVILFISEFEYHYYWLMNNMTVGLFMFILVYILVENNKLKSLYDILIASLCSVIIIIARTEGGIYVALILAAALLLTENVKFTRLISMISLAFVVLYNAWIMLSTGGFENAFWSVDKALLSIASLAFVFGLSFIYKFMTDKFAFVNKHSLAVFSTSLAVFFVLAVYISSYEVARQTINVMLIHLAEPTLISLAFLIITVIVTIIFEANRKNDRESGFCLFLITAYIIITMCIVFFRAVEGEPLPMRVGFGDSGRRITLQMIPFTILLFSRLFIRRIKNYEADTDVK